METVFNYFSMKYGDGRGKWIDNLLYRFRMIAFSFKKKVLLHGLHSPRSHKESDMTEQLSLHFISLLH